MPPNATIADIARHAGVGTATVDRVLNRRPGVNAETVQRVLQVVAEFGAPPQRGRPRIGENFRFAFVLPADGTPFNELVDRLIAQAAGEFRHQHITEVTHRFDSADAAAFAAELAHLGECDGVAVMAPDLPPVKLAINELVRTGVHVVTLFSDVAGSMRETHIGADNRAAGRTAGLLLGRMAAGSGSGGRDTLLLSSQATRLSGEIERRIGFAQVIEERFPKLKVQRTPDLPPGDAGACRALLRYLRSDSGRCRAHRRRLQRRLRQRRRGACDREPGPDRQRRRGGARLHRRTPRVARRRRPGLCAAPGHPLLHLGGGACAARAVRERARGTQRGATADRNLDGREPSLNGGRMCARDLNQLGDPS